MKRLTVLPRISEFAFAMMPMAFMADNDWWAALAYVAMVFPLLAHMIVAIVVTRKSKTPFVNNLFGYDENYVDVAIACLGIVNCLMFDMWALSFIWVVSLCCIFITKVLSKK